MKNNNFKKANIKFAAVRANNNFAKLHSLNVEDMDILFNRKLSKIDLEEYYQLKNESSLRIIKRNQYLHVNKNNFIFTLVWIQKILNYFHRELKIYKEKLEEINFYVFSEDYQKAEENLKDCINLFGPSLKLLEIETLLISLKKLNKRLIKIDEEDRSLNWYQYITESKCNNIIEDQKLQNLIIKTIVNKDVQNYFLFKLTDYSVENINFYENILNFDLQIRGNIYDLYESYVRIVEEYNLTKTNEKILYKNSVILNKNIKDSNLIFLKKNEEFSEKEINERLNLFKLEINKDYNNLFHLSKNIFIDNFNKKLIDITSLLLSIKAAIFNNNIEELEFLDSNENTKKIKQSFLSIYNLDHDTYFNAYNLYRHLSKYDVFHWSQHLKNSVIEYINIPNTHQDFINSTIHSHYRDIFFNPYHYLYLRKSALNEYKIVLENNIKKEKGLTNFYKIIDGKIKNQEELETENLILSIIFNQKKQHNINDINLTKKDRLSLEIKFLRDSIKTESIIKILPNFINILFKNYHLYPLFPFEEIGEKLVTDKTNSIILEKIIFYYKIIENEIEMKTMLNIDIKTKISVLIEKYIKQNFKTIENVLSNNFASLNEYEIYFYRNIFKKEFLKYTLLFEDEIDIDKFRIKVCQKILEYNVNADFAEELSEEITETAKNIAIIQGQKIINMSKIHVDTDYVKKVSIAKLKNSYQTFKELKGSGTEAPNVFFIEDVDDLSSIIEMLKNKESISIQDQSRLKHIISEVLDEFLKGPYGLNSFLSTSIRHGVLTNTLRFPLENEELICPKDTKVTIKWNVGSETLNNDIILLLNKFEEKLDLEISHLINNKIQVNMLDNSEALFRYYFTDLDLYNLNNKPEDIESLVEETIRLLWKKTENNLTQVKDYLNNFFKENIKLIFDDLLNDFELLSQKYSISLSSIVDKIILCRSNILLQIDEVKSWFNRSYIFNYSDYQISTVVEIAKKMINEINSRFTHWENLEIHDKSDHSIKIPGKNLNSLVYVFFGLFENACKHSQLEPNDLKIEMYIENFGDLFEIQFHSNINNNKLYLEDIENKLNEIKDIISTNNVTRHAQKDSSSGIFKLYNLINQNNSLCNNFNFNLDKINSKFIVNFSYQVVSNEKI